MLTAMFPASILALGSFILKYYVVKRWKKCTGLIVKKHTKTAEGEVEQRNGPTSVDVEAPAPRASTNNPRPASASVDSIDPPARRGFVARSKPKVLIHTPGPRVIKGKVFEEVTLFNPFNWF